MDSKGLKYLKLLAKDYKNINEASTEIINLSAILNLPKGTEHFLSDIHGEDESFDHVLKNASGVIKDYIEELFADSLMGSEKRNLATLTYYPSQKLEYIKERAKSGSLNISMNEWYKLQLLRLLKLCRRVSSKYTRSKVRKAMPKDFAYILDELIHENSQNNFNITHKNSYYNEIIDNIILLNRADSFIIAISEVIQRLAIDHLHILGDIYDRGSGAAKIIDRLIQYHSLDVQWGNHDIIWMGAASGCLGCICNVIRIQARYDNLETVEEDYGINLIPLATLAIEHYTNDPCLQFTPKNSNKPEKEVSLIAKMHKAISIIQFKIEAQIIKRHPEYDMENRVLLDKIDYTKGTITIQGTTYPLTDALFPTIDPKDPLKLHKDEEEVISKIRLSFKNSHKLAQHVRFLYNLGSMYKIYNSSLLFHGCIPLEENLTFKKINIFGQILFGKSYLDKLDEMARKAYFGKENTIEKQQGIDTMWYLWSGPDSPLFGKDKMTTFERYFISDKKTHIEIKDPYYDARDNEEIAIYILKEFGLDNPNAKIINGHVPVKVSKGENPVKANGKILVIDGGFAKAYQKETGIAGYTLIFNSRGLLLAAHAAFGSAKEAIENEADIVSDTFYVEKSPQIKRVKDTDKGKNIMEQISDLKELLSAYELGIIKESKTRD